MINIGDKYLAIYPQCYIAIIEYVGLNKEVNIFKYGKRLFKIIDFINKKPHVYKFEINKIVDDNVYYGNKDFLFSFKSRKKEIISAIFEL